MKRVLSILTARWLVTLIGAVFLSLLIWFLGPLIAIADYRPLESDIVRLVCVLVVLTAWGLSNLFRQMRAKQANEKLIEDVAGAPDDGTAAASAEEVAILKERLQDALGKLKQARLGGARGRQYLYQLPWYILIGPPGSGKTTALVNSGLGFPLDEDVGRTAVRGVGGTRNCDWWFTNEAVMLDTAGRYTTQDSHQAVDSAGWTGFLGLLKKHRPRQPLNGVIVALSLADMALLSETERLAHARSIRLRIRELYNELGVRFPVYVLFTKADLVAGFVEFFGDLGRDDREQVWGATFALDKEVHAEGAVAAFGREFDLLVERLNARLVERVHQEPDIDRRSLIFSFPLQFASLKAPIQAFLNEAFQPSRFDRQPLLRGFYFTSGTQEGTPIDRIMGAMAASFGLDSSRISAFSGTGRSYFLTRLLREVVFTEASVVSADARVECRRLWVHRGAYAAAALALVVTTGAWAWSYAKNEDLLDRAAASAEEYEAQIAGLDLDAVEDGDAARILPALNTLRQMPAGYDARNEGAPLEMRFGLYQGDKIGSQAVKAYRRALNSLLLPRLLFRLEEQIGRNLQRKDYLYEALKVYLMLGGRGPMDDGLVRQWMALDWANIYPGDANQGGRKALEAHLAALLEAPLKEIPLNGPLIENARRTLTQFPLAERAYALIKQTSAARELPEWLVVQHAGPAAARVFVRTSGKPLSEGVSGLYTYDGFHDVFLPALDDVARAVARESWVLGDQAAVAVDDAEIERLKSDLLGLYLNDYAARWDALLADLSVVPFSSMSHAVETLNTLSGPNSPLKELLLAITRETTLTKAPEQPASPAAVETAADKAEQKAAGTFSAAGRLANLVGTSNPKEADQPGQFIDDRFQALHHLVAGEPPPIDQMIALLGQLYQQLNRLSASPNKDEIIQNLGTGSGGGATQDLLTAASRLPEPVGGWLASVTRKSSAIKVGGARARLDALWKSSVLPLCRDALTNRYPFYRGSTVDVTLDDFTRLFAPNGLIDQFFTTHLLPFVDISARPWRWQRVDNVALGISPSVLAQFQRAARIRDGFFSGAEPGVRFEMLPVSLDASATGVLLEIDGQTITYNHGPQRPAELQWPGPGPGRARVTFSPEASGRSSSLTKNGPWAWFHMLDEGNIERTSLSDRFRVTFSVGGRSATYELRAGSVINPFTLQELGEFRCPPSL